MVTGDDIGEEPTRCGVRLSRDPRTCSRVVDLALTSLELGLELRRKLSDIVKSASDLAPIAGAKFSGKLGGKSRDLIEMKLQRLP